MSEKRDKNGIPYPPKLEWYDNRKLGESVAKIAEKYVIGCPTRNVLDEVVRRMTTERTDSLGRVLREMRGAGRPPKVGACESTDDYVVVHKFVLEWADRIEEILRKINVLNEIDEAELAKVEDDAKEMERMENGGAV